MKSCKWLLAINLLVLGGGACVIGALLWAVSVHGLSARAKPWAIEAWAAEQVRDLATPSRVKSLKNPITITPEIMAEARDHFADHCSTCHGNDGKGKTMLGDGMYPPPPDLSSDDTQELSDGEIFNVIKEGIRFTGMPGFGGSDEDNWKLAAFIRHIPKLSEKEVGFMKDINGMENTHAGH